MKKLFFLVSFSFLALMLIGCPPNKVKCPDGMEVTLPECTKLIKYDAGKLDIKTVSITIPAAGTTFSIGGVTWNREKLQNATNAAMMLDNQNYQNCKDLPMLLSVCKNDNECRKTVMNYRDNEEKINQLAMFIEANNPKAVDRWLDMYFTKQTKTALTKGPESTEQQYVLKKSVKAKPKQLFLKDK
jgi:hypothetical protein